jgi:hypothetical protein
MPTDLPKAKYEPQAELLRYRILFILYVAILTLLALGSIWYLFEALIWLEHNYPTPTYTFGYALVAWTVFVCIRAWFASSRDRG